MTQTDKLLDHMATGAPITKTEALEMGITSFSQILSEMRRAGCVIAKDKTTTWPVKPGAKWEAVYWLE